MALYVSQHVLDLEIVKSGAGWILLGLVRGSKRDAYEVSIELALTLQGQVAQWDSLCECPVGTQCKHGVALMLKAAQQGLCLMSGSAAVSIAAPSLSADQIEEQPQAALAQEQLAARMMAESHLLNWLRDLDPTSATPPRTGGVSKIGQSQARPEHYVYLLSVVQAAGGRAQLVLEAAMCKRKANGDWAKPRLLRYATFSGQQADDYATTKNC